MSTATADAAFEHDLASNLRCMRKRLGMSQDELAQRVGLNRGNIASYEKGSAEPKLCNLLRLSHFLGVSIHDLTRSDLSCENRYRQAYASYLRLNNEEAAELTDFESASVELRGVYEGIVRCHGFVHRQHPDLGPDARLIDAHFTQLREVTEELLRKQAELQAFVKARLRA